MRLLSPLLVLTLISGCARYEYQLTQPPELAKHIGTKSDAIVARDPLEYRLLTYENVLVMRVLNHGDAPVQLLGNQSTVVDPRGQSHPLRNQAIAPQSFLKLLFPPPKPEYYYHPGPTIGIGVGTVVGTHRVGRNDSPPDARPTPVYLSSVGDDSYFWDWEDEGEIRLDLVYQSGDRSWRDQFTIRRVKMK